ncbi:MAG: cation:proton antiporter [bacterium]|nr:cation:proton antiporter [bacterium]
MNFLLLLGICILAGTVGARIFQRLKIPQVVGYIVIGLIIGETGLKIISATTIEFLRPFTYFALGIIGFIIGGELKTDLFRKFGKQFFAMVIGEGIGAFLIVTPFAALFIWFMTRNFALSIAISIVIGAISSATDPASTIQVLWEYKTRGLLTTAVMAIVALDDALALTLYAFATNMADIFIGNSSISISHSIFHFLYELLGAAALGIIFGYILKKAFRYLNEHDKMLPFSIGLILVTIGLSNVFNLDIILSSMFFGITTVNLIPKRSEETFDLVKKFAPPIYVLFFVFVGARLQLSHLTLMIIIIAAIYLAGRSFGKIIGAYIGAKISGAPDNVKKYSGLCLFTQGGVAVGLSIMAGRKFSPEIADIIITVITATTLVVQLIGPSFVKYALKEAGEIGLNLTEEELIACYKVGDVMDTNPPIIRTNAVLGDILKTFSKNDYFAYPVADSENMLAGFITFQEVKHILTTSGLDMLLLAHDIMNPIRDIATPQTPLKEAFEQMKQTNANFICVVENTQSRKLAGFLELNKVNMKIAEELITRKKKAEGIA